MVKDDLLLDLQRDAVPAKNWRNGENYLIDILVVYPAAGDQKREVQRMSRRPLPMRLPIPIYVTGRALYPYN